MSVHDEQGAIEVVVQDASGGHLTRYDSDFVPLMGDRLTIDTPACRVSGTVVLREQIRAMTGGRLIQKLIVRIAE